MGAGRGSRGWGRVHGVGDGRGRADRRGPPGCGRRHPAHARLDDEDPRGFLRAAPSGSDGDADDQRASGCRQPDPLPGFGGRPAPGHRHLRRGRGLGPRGPADPREGYGRGPDTARHHLCDPELARHSLRGRLAPVLVGRAGGRLLRGPRRPHGDRRGAHLRGRQRLLLGRPGPRRRGLLAGPRRGGDFRAPRRGRGCPRGSGSRCLGELGDDGGAAALDARPLG